ncbi:phosphate ABC transporter permease subunit PstC [Hippea maritima]|uniref:Phosphate transport system permease protein n=1 Tax=Hippea maritima (strain ATCC 700847 / DSM 10411 / MH2) TaxID=760142 RepID=F2LVS5_HIPMA|nr:phosphate ABC transporter permease subunit PstC [Hippea maritima]AEA33859.1 phosphate ABC transporter, inner membrane subunit PstC [Hippea maritima DSM 10411]
MRSAYKKKDLAFKNLSYTLALLVIFISLAMLVVLLVMSYPAIQKFGVINFIFSDAWNPVKKVFGGATAIYGTLITTLLALIFAIPTSLGIGIFLSQICPDKLKRAFSLAIELLASIPSIIYGMWGLFTLAPIMRNYIEPFLQRVFLPIPVVGLLFRGTPLGIDLLTSGLILSIMIIPFIASISRDTFDLVPKELIESAYGMGATKWEVIKDVILPYSKVGVISGIIIATGRALGETMAVAFVLGNDHTIHLSLLKSSTTISVALANEFTEADFRLYLASLFYLALILYVMSFTALGIAKFLLRRYSK